MHGLEICLTTGQTFTSFRTNVVKERPFKIIKVGLTRPRAELYARINERVDEMIAQGLVEEVKAVLPYRSLNSLNTVGYKEILQYLDGVWTLEEAIEKIKHNSRIYSKKQMTWFKRDAAIAWFHPDDHQAILDYVAAQIQES